MDESLHKAINKVYFFLKFRPRSKRELEDYLNKKAKRFHWPVEVVAKALDSLECQGLADDKKFVEWYVNTRSKLRAKSEKLLKRGLMRFGIDKFLIEDFFEEHPADDSVSATSALEKAWGRWENLDKRKRFEKAANYLTRRGFSYSLIKNTIAEIENSA